MRAGSRGVDIVDQPIHWRAKGVETPKLHQKFPFGRGFLVNPVFVNKIPYRRALGLAAAFRPSASREQKYLAYKPYLRPEFSKNLG